MFDCMCVICSMGTHKLNHSQCSSFQSLHWIHWFLPNQTLPYMQQCCFYHFQLDFSTFERNIHSHSRTSNPLIFYRYSLLILLLVVNDCSYWLLMPLLLLLPTSQFHLCIVPLFSNLPFSNKITMIRILDKQIATTKRNISTLVALLKLEENICVFWKYMCVCIRGEKKRNSKTIRQKKAILPT